MPAIDDSDSSSPSWSPRRRQALAIFVIALLWLTIAAGVLVVGVEGNAMRNQLDTRSLLLLIASLVVQIAPPVAILGLTLAAVRRSRPDAVALIEALEARQARANAAGAALRADTDAVDRALAGVGDRLAALQVAVACDAHGLAATATRLEVATSAMTGATQISCDAAVRMQGLIEGSQHQAETVTMLLEQNGAETGRQLHAVETMVAGVWTRNAEAAARVDSASTAMQVLLAAVEVAATRATAAVGDHAAALHGKADTAFERIGAALAASRDGIAAQNAALLAGVDHARERLDNVGGEAARVIGKRLDRLNDAAGHLTLQLSEQEARSQALVETVERSFTVLDARLDHASRNSYSTLDGIAERMAVVGSQVQTLNLPLRQTHAVALEIEAAVARLDASVGITTEALATTLPDHHVNIGKLSDVLDQLHRSTIELGEPVERGRSAINAAATELGEHRIHLEIATRHLIAQFEAAHVVLGAVEAQAEGSALAASTQLIEVLGRVREIAAASAGQMRETLAGVIGEAEAALAHAGASTAEAAFGAPIRQQLVAIEAASHHAAQAAQSAADRVAQRLLGLTSTVAAVEARIAEVQTHHDIQARDNLRARSTRLLESLNAASIDVARPLMLDVDDASWNAYLKGDRSIFTRRVVRLADAATSRAIKRHYDHDAPFRGLAVQFIDEFQRLLKYVDADKDGRALAITLLSSDIGKLGVILEQAIGRNR